MTERIPRTGLTSLYVFLVQIPDQPVVVLVVLERLQRVNPWPLLLLVLLRLSLTIALIWKTKEVILDSVFKRHG